MSAFDVVMLVLLLPVAVAGAVGSAQVQAMRAGVAGPLDWAAYLWQRWHAPRPPAAQMIVEHQPRERKS